MSKIDHEEVKMTMPDTITCSVDEHGRTIGFSIDGDAGSFGENLEPGQLVSLDDGGDAVIAKVYSHIQTGPSGVSNYVAVDVYPAE